MYSRTKTAAIAVATFFTLAITTTGPALASNNRIQESDVVVEWNDDGTAASGGAVVGKSTLIRRADNLTAWVRVQGLIPGGVYTFWWIVPHAQDPAVPFDVFVANGASAIARKNGKVTVRMRAHKGQQGIQGFPPIGGLSFHELTDTLNTVVRVEVAYHGQAIDAGGDIATWITDFWTGTACPVDPTTPQGEVQPHCPVRRAATHIP